MVAALRRYPLIVALAVAAVVLGAIVAYEAVYASLHAQGVAAGAQNPAPVQPKLLPPMPVTVAEQAYPETVARPLLSPNRRPAPEKVAGPVSTMQKGRYTLTGVTIVGPLRIALLREKASGRVVRAEKGKEIEGVTVQEIEAESVTLAMGGDQETISLQVQKGVAAPAAVAATGPFAGPQPGQPGAPAEAPMPPGQNPAQRAPIPPPNAFGPGAVPGAPPPPAPASGFGPAAAPAPAGQANATLTPEELLARRRARRTQPTQ